MLSTKFLKKSFLCQCFDFSSKLITRNTSNASPATANALRNLKAKSTNNYVQFYVDKCQIRTVGGSGGNGCVHFLSEFAREEAGPDGGNGGSGGHVVFLCTTEVKNLNHFHSLIEAKHGEKGIGKNCDGKNAPHNIIRVPIGTIVKDLNNKVLADLDRQGMMFVAARGGSGGRGNKFFATATQQAPEIAEYGAEGEKITYILEIRSMAHVGLLGFPNAGKSTLLRAISRARPRVAPYPFTTLQPHIGMVQYDDYNQIAVADLPGLIPGSHKNKGLGIEFLQHVQRCCCLLFLLDTSVPEPWEQLTILRYELSQFNEELLQRPQLVIANKMDLPEAQKNFPKLKKRFPDLEIMSLSAKTGTNISQMLKAIRRIYDEVQTPTANS